MLDEFQPAIFNTCFATSNQQEVMHVQHERPALRSALRPVLSVLFPAINVLQPENNRKICTF
jgi:hypothetical protein